MDMEVLVRIKQLVIRGRIRFTIKAYAELDEDGLDTGDVSEAILNAPAIEKTLRLSTYFANWHWIKPIRMRSKHCGV